MTIEIRSTSPEEYRTASDTMSAALMTRPHDDERWERSLPSWEEMISYSAWDGDACVGHGGQFAIETLVPGGARLPTGAVSRVGVSTTARRKGVATALMHELVHDSHRRGFALMSLRASESTIYERFGFGIAGEFCDVTLDPARAVPLRGAAVGGAFRILAAAEVLDVVPNLYERVAFRRPGCITRPSSWNRRLFGNVIDREKAAFVVVHSDAEGVDDGYAHYETEWNDDHPDGPTGRGEVFDVFATTDAAEIALWQFLCDVDLVTRWRITERPVDDVVRHACRDARAYRTRAVDDEQWLRIIDVDAALSQRSYRAVDRSVNIAVDDPLLPANTGTWKVDSGGAANVDAAPDLVCDVSGVSAAYLGGMPWQTLVATGRVVERTPGSAVIADDLFASVPLPFCGTFF